MSKRMDKTVYGIIGLSSIMGNWNADFTGNPKTTLNGEIFGSDKALKYSFRKFWVDSGKNVLYFKSFKENLQVRTLDERYELFFETDKKEKKEKGSKDLDVLKNLFNAIDVKNFGATFPSKKYGTFNILGVVQIGQGFNFYKNTTNTQDILSPFKNSNNENADNSTIGKMILTDETHYFYPFTINPLAIKEYEELGVTEGYTENDYKTFKETSLKSVTALNSASKFGCSNEFALFIETETGTYLPPVDKFLSFEKGTEKIKIKFKLGKQLESIKDKIKNVEVYFNSDFMEFETDIADVKILNM